MKLEAAIIIILCSLSDVCFDVVQYASTDDIWRDPTRNRHPRKRFDSSTSIIVDGQSWTTAFGASCQNKGYRTEQWILCEWWFRVKISQVRCLPINSYVWELWRVSNELIWLSFSESKYKRSLRKVNRNQSTKKHAARSKKIENTRLKQQSYG